MRARALALVVAVAIGAAGPAAADVAIGDRAPRGWYLGLNLRTDYGPHRTRVDVGARRGALAATLVVDPKVFFDPLQNDTDVLVEWIPRPGGWAPLLGYRLTQISIDRGRQFHDILLVGASGGLPALVRGRVRGRFGVEVELTVVRHGAGIQTELLSFASQRAFRDLLSINLFLRLEYAGAL